MFYLCILQIYLKINFIFLFKQKNIDSQLADKFLECKDIFRKYESKGDLLNANIAHILGIVFGKLSEIQIQLNAEVSELVLSIEKEIIRPLVEYQVKKKKKTQFL